MVSQAASSRCALLPCRLCVNSSNLRSRVADVAVRTVSTQSGALGEEKDLRESSTRQQVALCCPFFLLSDNTHAGVYTRESSPSTQKRRTTSTKMLSEAPATSRGIKVESPPSWAITFSTARDPLLGPNAVVLLLPSSSAAHEKRANGADAVDRRRTGHVTLFLCEVTRSEMIDTGGRFLLKTSAAANDPAGSSRQQMPSTAANRKRCAVSSERLIRLWTSVCVLPLGHTQDTLKEEQTRDLHTAI